jgi:MoxR-like ATPase
MGVAPVVDADTLAVAITAVRAIQLSEPVAAYVVALVRATRASADISAGASPRAAAQLAVAARARAALEGRDYVIPDDVKALALPALRHRILLSPAAEIEGRTADVAVQALIDRIEAPR